MKPQDIVFFGIFAVIFLMRRKELFVWAGLSCLVLAIPLFAHWVFFTAERLTWYAATFFLAFILHSFVKQDNLPYNKRKGDNHL